ncbi:hypothetical protein PPL_11357 [Heterostelium album PN500]|uniref:A20-type domain-containing protein n=1 Tax=Heterostelium pallidum (strain ATCC 26659 / Pp 5 / PN500) TaxID=670386 RepID=D3BT65_HETP5|nr:hypothetical protein PPL_11357 [Heterostelium album PN500]EFA75282.1 hypothetical protein PPL_11357 [Heterostelium album PN500]|eukprot:XP_020427416.1 hypothetical protein PPL_11357 [Heterostelium album PN500]
MSSSLNEKVDNEQNATESNIGTSTTNTNNNNNNNIESKEDKDKQMEQQQQQQQQQQKEPTPSEPAKAELCKNNCGFYGNPKTRGLCSTCYNKELKNELQQQPPHISIASAMATSPDKPKAGTKRSIYEATYFDQQLNSSNNNNNIVTNTTTTTTTTATTTTTNEIPLSSSPASSSFSSSSLTPTKQIPQISTKDSSLGSGNSSNSSGGGSPSSSGSSNVLLTPTKSAPIPIGGASPSSPQTLNNSPSVSSPVGSPSGKESAKCAYDNCGKRLPGIMSESNRCRCGGTYCGKHMHNHECQFDYKSMAKTTIAKANPQIMANKIVKL